MRWRSEPGQKDRWGELPDDVYHRVTQLCATGDDLVRRQRFDDALMSYRRALELLPGRAPQWEAATWIYSAIGDAHFLNDDPSAALEAFDRAMECPKSLGNPFLHMRRGQVLFDVGRRDEAANELTRAYMLEGEEILDSEDPVYLDYLMTVIRKPEGPVR